MRQKLVQTALMRAWTSGKLTDDEFNNNVIIFALRGKTEEEVEIAILGTFSSTLEGQETYKRRREELKHIRINVKFPSNWTEEDVSLWYN